MKVGIYGGSFNPIHNGHIALAEAFLRQAELDEVWFMVSPQNPLKANAILLDDKIRFKTAFDRWYHHEDILQNYKIVIYPRLGDEIGKNELPNSVSLLNAEFINISSTEIRERIANGKSIDHLVPAEIAVEMTNAYSHQS